MDYRSLHHFSRKSLKGHYRKALCASWAMPLLWSLYRLIPVGLAGLLLVRGDPAVLREGGWLWLSFLVLWSLFCMGMMLPVRCAVWKRFGTWLGMTRMRTCFGTVREYCRAAWILGLAGILQLAAALPVTAAALLTIRLLQEGSRQPHAGWYLFGAVQAAAVFFWTGLFAVRLRVSLFAVPLLCTEFPQDGAFTIIRRSFRLLDGQHPAFWSIVLCYLPAMLAVLPMPFLLPRLYADLTLFLQLRIRESSGKEGKVCLI